MTTYRRMLERLAREHLCERMPSAEQSQAVDWLETCLQFAEHDVRIFVERLDWDVLASPRVIKAATKFLARSSTRIMLLAKRPMGAQTELSKVTNAHRLSIRFARGSYTKPEAKLFAVMDEVGYRFEERSGVVIANFNEPKVAARLSAAFDDAFKLGTSEPLGTSTARSERELVTDG